MIALCTITVWPIATGALDPGRKLSYNPFRTINGNLFTFLTSRWWAGFVVDSKALCGRLAAFEGAGARALIGYGLAGTVASPTTVPWTGAASWLRAAFDVGRIGWTGIINSGTVFSIAC